MFGYRREYWWRSRLKCCRLDGGREAQDHGHLLGELQGRIRARLRMLEVPSLKLIYRLVYRETEGSRGISDREVGKGLRSWWSVVLTNTRRKSQSLYVNMQVKNRVYYPSLLRLFVKILGIVLWSKEPSKGLA